VKVELPENVSVIRIDPPSVRVVQSETKLAVGDSSALQGSPSKSSGVKGSNSKGSVSSTLKGSRPTGGGKSAGENVPAPEISEKGARLESGKIIVDETARAKLSLPSKMEASSTKALQSDTKAKEPKVAAGGDSAVAKVQDRKEK
jgi:hypothetical protein